ncbi:Hypp5775 [Branchiostoma lanceolatum]|uniref:Hypp5775 protein n=1 Tax=Branchiostoma lanceolatum TaxID=7740 RepID=A0A8J9W7F1_BRALA|nr:Hypp5775 [Branchiostoma lanceolatum]
MDPEEEEEYDSPLEDGMEEEEDEEDQDDADLNSPLPEDMLDEPLGAVGQSRQWMESDEGALDREYESDPEIYSEEEESLTGEEREGGPPITEKQKQTRSEHIRMMALRKHLDQLSEKVLEKEYQVQKCREALKTCREKLEILEKERDQVYLRIKEEEEKENNASVHRLRAQHGRLLDELTAEETLEKQIIDQLDEAEYTLAKAQVEQGKFLLAGEELRLEEERMQKERTENATQRGRRELLATQQAERRRKTREREHMAAVRERERKHRQAMAAARRSREQANKFLKETLARVRAQDTEDEERSRQQMEHRMRTLLSLKTNITANRENLRAVQARDRAMATEAAVQEEGERQEVLGEGGNPEEVLLRRKRQKQFEREKETFEAQQREKQQEIVARIIREEKQMKHRKTQQPQLWPDARRDRAKRVQGRKRKSRIIQHYTSGSSSVEYSADVEEVAPPKGPQDNKLATVSSDDDFSPYGLTSRDERGDSESDSREGEDDENMAQPEFAGLWDQEHTAYKSDSREGEDDENMAQPEFAGLWDQEHTAYKVPEDHEIPPKPVGGTRMEQQVLQQTLEKHRSGIIRKQVAAGREFKGQPFYSKPDVIHFKDFDVGKTYKKKIQLTNVSYSVNFCRLVGLSEHLKDFIHLVFDPPGQMSAGMSCDMMVTFKPMINEDLEGAVEFLAQTGPFFIPLRCTTKKCDLSVDIETVDFGTQVIGETLKKTITLTNKGALGTKFEFIKVSDAKPRTVTTAETSLGRLTSDMSDRAVSSLSDQEKVHTAESGHKPDIHVTPPDEKALEGDGEGDAGKDGDGGRWDVTREGETTVDFGLGSDFLDVSALDGMKIGQVAMGDIGPFSSVKLEIIFAPTVPGKVDTDFEISFSDPCSDSIFVRGVANAIDVPVWVERQNVDLKICMFDRLYQDSIVVNNRATTALRLRFEVPKELRDHMELLPKTGYIQAQSQFSAQLKFLPRQTLSEDAPKSFDKETGVLEAPMVIRVADQTRPVPFTIQAIVTSSDFEFDRRDIDFGFCSIYESVKTTIKLTNKSILAQPYGFVSLPETTIKLTNKSILAQPYGFVSLPETVDVQPNDGFGTLLPLETIELDLIFNAKKAKEYSFELTCKSGINRDFKLSCKAVGVHPPLELSQSVIHFAATALIDSSIASLHVVNSHISRNEFTHPVPRIGKGEIAPVGPTSFEFVVPEGAPVNVSPAVGTVLPGKKSHVTVTFSPSLLDTDIREEVVRIRTRLREAQLKREEEEAAMAARKSELETRSSDKKGKKADKKGKSPSDSPAKGSKSKGPTPGGEKKDPEVEIPSPDAIDPSSDEYAAARAALMRNYRGRFHSYTVPCFVASGECGDPGKLPYNKYNTLYLEIHCPSVRPSLIVISNHGRTMTDFGEVSIGQSVVKSITIQNISDKTQDLKSSILDTSGPFLLLNSLRALQPEATHTLIASFTPQEGRNFYETLEVHTPTSTLGITLQGRGMTPLVSLSVEGVLDMGHALAGEAVTETFKITNTSTLAVDYTVQLDSQSYQKPAAAQGLPEFLQRGEPGRKNLVGTSNNSGMSVFSCTPSVGNIPAGGSQEVTVTFNPDHHSLHYSDGARIVLFGQDEAAVLQLKGRGWDHTMYVEGCDPLDVSVESLEAQQHVEEEEEGPEKLLPMLLTFRYVQTEDKPKPAERVLDIGCIRSLSGAAKKSGEYSVDNLQLATPKGFNVDQPKATMEAGSSKKVVFTWAPPAGHDPSEPVEATVQLVLKGDATERYKVLLRGLVVSG